MKRSMIAVLGLAAVLLAAGPGVADTFNLNGIAFNSDYGPAQGYVAYIQPYDSTNQLQKSGQAIIQYGDVGAVLGTHSEGTQFATPAGQPFGAAEAVNWAASNYVVTYWWDKPGYAPCNGLGGDIYIYQPAEGVRPMGILYKGEWKMFDAGTNGLPATNGADFWWDLADAGVADGDTIQAIAYWSNALGMTALNSEHWDGSRDEFNAKIKTPIMGPTALDMDGDGVAETLTFVGGGTAMGYHDAFYMAVGNASHVAVPEPATMALFALGGLPLLAKLRRRKVGRS